MPLLSERHGANALNDRLREAYCVTTALMSEIIEQTCRRFPSAGQSGKTARIEQLMACAAWTDAALALTDLELPQWQVRRIVYDEGEWHCALSRERELPEWLDQSIESRHADLALAILGAFVEARHISAPSKRTSVPAVPYSASVPCDPVCCENFA